MSGSDNSNPSSSGLRLVKDEWDGAERRRVNMGW